MPTPDEHQALSRRRDELRQELAHVAELRQGSLSSRYRRCGKPRCHCAQKGDPGHGPYWSVTRERLLAEARAGGEAVTDRPGHAAWRTQAVTTRAEGALMLVDKYRYGVHLDRVAGARAQLVRARTLSAAISG